MKRQLTRREVLAIQPNIRFCGYCDLQTLLSRVEPYGYNAGEYGWNYDVYVFPGLTLLTGYRGTFGIPLTGCSEYEKRARALGPDASDEDRQALVDEFVALNKEGGYHAF